MGKSWKLTSLKKYLKSVDSNGSVKKSTMKRCSSSASKEHFAESSKVSQEDIGVEMAERLINVFYRLGESVVQSYFESDDFAHDLMLLCSIAREIFVKEDRLLKLNGPVYVFGDIHGNLEDLFFFRDRVWPQGMDAVAGKFLFLGDYVDRGHMSIEVVTYLLAWKIMCPSKVFMMRGNHELRNVNGWENHYGNKCLSAQCKNRFGFEIGELVWETINTVFDVLPLAATLDDNIFCTHGGLPRNSLTDRLELVQSIPKEIKFSSWNCGDSADFTDEHKRVMSDLLWGDPYKGNVEDTEYVVDGFVPGSRGGSGCMFTREAVEEFCIQYGFSKVLRAHQASETGISVLMNGQVITVFSTSKDHGMGKNASCAYLLYEDGNLTAINKVPKSKSWTNFRRDDMQQHQICSSAAA